MSIYQRLADDELSDVSLDELLITLGEYTTARAYAKVYTINTEHGIPFAAGNSLDRKTVYIDHELYQEVMDGAFKATDLAPTQIVECWADHEHSEICIVDGDNPVDLYYGGHRCALKKEHLRITNILGRRDAKAKIANYEKVIWPGLQRCYKRPVKNPPKDLWCAPILDEPDARGEEIIKALIKAGVVDAGKRSKYETHYGLSGRPCESCRHWSPKQLSLDGGTLAACQVVTGAVRRTRHCDFYRP
jgi:hypothetical protein